MKPFVKWAGGKRQILSRINEYIKDYIGDSTEGYTYIEPFLGGGAVFFGIKPKNAILNDLNTDLINAYRVIKSQNCEELITLLEQHNKLYKEDPDGYYYDVRHLDREEGWPNQFTEIERAARMIFLNKTCYNGLYRVNSKGEFNTPMGRYRNPLICDKENIREIHRFFNDNNNNIEIMNSSYEEAIRKAQDGDIIYVDPPYDYEDDDGFTKYHMSGFTFEDFKKLKIECDKAVNKGAYVLISNNATTKVLDLFNQDPRYKILYTPDVFSTLRSINSKGEGRRTGKEVIIVGIPGSVPFPQANDIEKVVKLAMCKQEILDDREKAMEILEVSTNRQVSYYLSALMYFNYINYERKLTNRILNIQDNSSKIREDIIKQLLEKEIFTLVYDKLRENENVDTNEISNELRKFYPKLSKATLDRRSSTIKRWVVWMKGQ